MHGGLTIPASSMVDFALGFNSESQNRCHFQPCYIFSRFLTLMSDEIESWVGCLSFQVFRSLFVAHLVYLVCEKEMYPGRRSRQGGLAQVWIVDLVTCFLLASVWMVDFVTCFLLASARLRYVIS